jgi:hypothetical protein
MDRLRAALGLASLGAAAACAFLVAAPPAAAMQEYAKKEGKECSFCHLNPKGSGPRNAQGQEYEANGHRFGVKSWTTDENRRKFLRASSALVATWYAEADRILGELAKEETLPGGLALIDGTRERFRMFPRAWAGAARKLAAQEERGLAKRLEFLAKLESQFPGTDEGKDAAKALDELARDAAKGKSVEAARAAEKVRVLFLRGRMEWDLGEADAARATFAKVTADPLGKPFEAEIADLLAGKPRK